MSAHTVEDFQASLARDLSWRKQEITALRLSALRSSASRDYLFRAGLVLLCAHWEGFLRNSVECYIEHVFAQGLRVRELTPVFVAVAYFGDVRRAADAGFPGSQETHVRLAERILRGTDEVCSTAGWTARTEGNPSSEVLHRLMLSVGLNSQLGLDGASWSATRVFIDEQLLRDRHRVAHGDGFRVSRSEFLDRTRRMLGLLDRLSSELLNAAEQRTYRAIVESA